MRHSASNSYVTPVSAAGATQVESGATFGRGSFTLTLGTTYFFPLGGQDGPWLDAQCQWDSGIVITSITVETCSFPDGDVSDHSDNAGEWIKQVAGAAFVPTDGAGVTVSAAGVVAVAGGAQGGCDFQMAENCARRTRLAVVVGATGGAMRVGTWAKE